MATPEKLRLREKLSYGCGDLASCLYWGSFSNFLLIFYTDVFGITGAAIATMFFWSRIWDGVNDPMLGALADRTQTRWGKFRPYLLWTCVPFAIAGVLMFTTPTLGMTGKLIWAWITYNLMMMFYTTINIPYTAMLGVISSNPIERTAVSSIKFLFAFAAGLIVKATLPWMTAHLGGSSIARGWTLTFIVYGVVAVGLFLITFSGTRERVSPPAAQKTNLGRDILDLVTNHPWRMLLATTLPFILFVATRGTIMAHYIKYYVGRQTLTLPFLGTRTYGYEEIVSTFGICGDFAAIAGVLLVTPVAKWLGKKAAFIVLFTISIVATGVFEFLRPDQLGLMYVLQFVGSMTGGPLSVLLWAMYADAADYSEWKRGRRSTGLVFSASTMSQKVGWAMGGYIAARMLFATGFIPNAAQSVAAISGIRLMMGLIPAGAGLVALIIFLFYPLSEKRVTEIEAELEKRRAAAGAAPVAA